MNNTNVLSRINLSLYHLSKNYSSYLKKDLKVIELDDQNSYRVVFNDNLSYLIKEINNEIEVIREDNKNPLEEILNSFIIILKNSVKKDSARELEEIINKIPENIINKIELALNGKYSINNKNQLNLF